MMVWRVAPTARASSACVRPRSVRRSRIWLVTRVALATEHSAVGAQLRDGPGRRAHGSDEEHGVADPERLEFEHREHEGGEQAAGRAAEGDPSAVAVDVAVAFVAGRDEL